MIIKGLQAVCHKVVYEAHYKEGFTYLDRCGSTVNEIMRSSPEWILSESSPSPQNAPLVSLRNGTKFNFSTRKYDFGLEQPVGTGKELEQKDISEFIGQVDLVSSIVNERLSLKDFSRIGLRIWYLFPAITKEISEQWISQLLKEMPIDDSIAKAFGGIIEAKNYVIIISSNDRRFRISINGVERHAQADLGDSILNIRASTLSKDQNKFLMQQMKARKRIRMNPDFAAMIDVDSFVEMPKDVEAKDYITESLKQIEAQLPRAFT